MHGTPVAAGVGMLTGEEERSFHWNGELVRSMDRSFRNIGVGTQAVRVELPVMQMTAQQMPAQV